MILTDDAPILADMIAGLSAQRSAADARADGFARLLADVELLHEPGAGGDCPTCLVEAPCLTLRLVRREITVDDAVVGVRERRVIDLDETTSRPSVPSLKELLSMPPRGIDRFFDALLGLPPTG